MSFTRSYIKTTLTTTLKEAIEVAIPGLLQAIVLSNNSQTLLYLSREPTAQEDIDLLALVNANVASDAVYTEQAGTDTRMKEGFDTYKKIFAHIIVNDPIGSIDSFISIYPQISTLRMLLKDAMFESCVRYMETSIKPLGAFTYFETYRTWIRELAKSHNDSLDDATLDYIETAPTGIV